MQVKSPQQSPLTHTLWDAYNSYLSFTKQVQIAMPILDGLSATQIIRNEEPFTNDPKIRTTPIIGLCTTSLRADHRRFIEQGMDDIITKPWNVEQIQPVLRWWAQRRVVVPRAGGGAVQGQRYTPGFKGGWGGEWRAFKGPRSRM
jgi:DNA-binding NarL/FixJ family response regulator